jgi:hypothetical protein
MNAPIGKPGSAARSVGAELLRYVPIVGWLPRYQWSGFAADAIAGATIWGPLIPEMIAYSGLAGLPPQAGLYTPLASPGLYAIFGTSRQLVVAGTWPRPCWVLMRRARMTIRPGPTQTDVRLTGSAGMVHPQVRLTRSLKTPILAFSRRLRTIARLSRLSVLVEPTIAPRFRDHSETSRVNRR